ncbi:MAG TPA: MCE family protein [Verrucomicrobia bacterium]|nr:MCE family protein [Verrucomicrobiota bacterium]HOB32313.1 MlaD family protein [Verrucomicrobiota bacterium]HOP96773.1 MlaD family protein [Verrucomicrobiota bacterium]HPU57261.1 MlaD family protein [Verrucomicrobiota bacterium]
MRNSLETRIGIFVALAALAAVFVLEMVGGIERLKPGYEFHALFDNVQELKVGDRVKIAGVEVGRVEKISLDQGKVRVTMKVRRDAGVKTDSIATVKFAGLLGQNFVALSFGSPDAPLAESGIELSTTEQPDLGAVLAKLDDVATGVENLTRSFTGVKIENLLGPFTDFLKANQAPLTATISNIQSITAQVSRGEGTVGRLIFEDDLYRSSLNTVSNLQTATEDIQVALAQACKVVDQVNAGQGTLGKLVTDETLYTEATAMMTNLREISEKINKGEGSVGKLVNDDEFYRNAKLSLQKLDKATEGLEDQGPLSVLGIAVNSLF